MKDKVEIKKQAIIDSQVLQIAELNNEIEIYGRAASRSAADIATYKNQLKEKTDAVDQLKGMVTTLKTELDRLSGYVERFKEVERQAIESKRPVNVIETREPANIIMGNGEWSGIAPAMRYGDAWTSGKDPKPWWQL